jgi:hypothetical protein
MNQTATTTHPDARMVMDACDSMGVRLNEPAFAKAVDRMLRAAEVGGGVSAAQVRAIVSEVVSDSQAFEGVAESFR